ncbi:MAG TPA: Rieske 2Fe-2S domain-containing protein [Jatrophihabitantaceae bacterium]|jgi:thiosulfate dehydrogenase [quinone] large subunit|nr:Rieske 2Fe-2S domain-containing protein [Jatrophihabitantaceae bacterium]
MTSHHVGGAAPAQAWTRRLHEPGALLLPMRAFLGVTFGFAGLQKLANPNYLDPHSPISVAAQMRTLQHSSPIGPLLGLSTHAPTAVGLLIAFAELAVGIGTLAGLYPRIAAAGGALLALTFFLTVSWNTRPYYYSADIVFVFAWLTMLGFGDCGVLSVGAWLRGRARGQLRLPPEPAAVSAKARAELDRRTVLDTGVAAAVAAFGALALGGITAALGRAAGGTRRGQTSALQGVTPSGVTAPPSSPPSPSGRSTTRGGSAPRGRSQPGTAIGPVSAVPVGQARSFTDPASGQPAWILQPSSGTFVAFSAVCTHAGCPVQFDQSTTQFVCPCHGGVYDARTGKVLQGPPPSPLPRIPVHVVAGQLRVDA